MQNHPRTNPERPIKNVRKLIMGVLTSLALYTAGCAHQPRPTTVPTVDIESDMNGRIPPYSACMNAEVWLTIINRVEQDRFTDEHTLSILGRLYEIAINHTAEDQARDSIPRDQRNSHNTQRHAASDYETDDHLAFLQHGNNDIISDTSSFRLFERTENEFSIAERLYLLEKIREIITDQTYPLEIRKETIFAIPALFPVSSPQPEHPTEWWRYQINFARYGITPHEREILSNMLRSELRENTGFSGYTHPRVLISQLQSSNTERASMRDLFFRAMLYAEDGEGTSSGRTQTDNTLGVNHYLYPGGLNRYVGEMVRYDNNRQFFPALAIKLANIILLEGIY